LTQENLRFDFWCTSLALLKPHLHTEMYDNTWLAYFINLLACGHQIGTRKLMTWSRYMEHAYLQWKIECSVYDWWSMVVIFLNTHKLPANQLWYEKKPFLRKIPKSTSMSADCWGFDFTVRS